MKTTIILLFCLISAKFSMAQQARQTIDYEYFRDDKQHYAFELFKNTSSKDDVLMLNFASNGTLSKIDKIHILKGAEEIKLKFKMRQDVVSSDNPELKFYPIMFSKKELEEKVLGCEAKVRFKMDNGIIYTLPLVLCNTTESGLKN